MSLYQCWYNIALHVFNGVETVGVIELMACIFTAWTVIMVALAPYFIIRRLTR